MGYGLSARFQCLKCYRNILSFLTLIALSLYLLVTASFTIHGSLPKATKQENGDATLSALNHRNPNSSKDLQINVQMVEMLRDGRVPPEYMRELERENAGESSIQLEGRNECELARWRTTEIFKVNQFQNVSLS